MATKTDFTPDEWKLLMDLPPLVGTAVMVVGKSGMTGTMKEAFAVAQGVLQGKDGFEDNELIAALVDARLKNKERSEVEQMTGNSYRGLAPDELLAAVLQLCEDVRVLLHDKSTPDESAGFRSWCVSVGEQVANAAKEGGFLQRMTGGERVSPKERTVLESVSQALNIDCPV